MARPTAIQHNWPYTTYNGRGDAHNHTTIMGITVTPPTTNYIKPISISKNKEFHKTYGTDDNKQSEPNQLQHHCWRSLKKYMHTHNECFYNNNQDAVTTFYFRTDIMTCFVLVDTVAFKLTVRQILVNLMIIRQIRFKNS